MTHKPANASPRFEDVIAAHRRIRRHVRQTPVRNEPGLDAELGCRVWCKCENLQEMGAFKIRGAMNAILALRERGIGADVATHSSGNHGAAVAAAAQQDGRGAVVVMPENAVGVKVQNVRRYGGEVQFCAASQAAREQGLQRLVAQGLIPIHPYDHHDIICGQGTAALELLQQQPDIGMLLAPVGGGGLITGCAIAVRGVKPGIRVVAAEPAGAADTAASLQKGARVQSWNPDTRADGLRALVGELTFPIIQREVEQVLTVSEAGIVRGMELIMHHCGMLIEPSSATVIAAILEYPQVFSEQHVGVIITGGNVELSDFPRLAGPDGD